MTEENYEERTIEVSKGGRGQPKKEKKYKNKRKDREEEIGAATSDRHDVVVEVLMVQR